MCEAKSVALALKVLSESNAPMELYVTEQDIREAKKRLDEINKRIIWAERNLEKINREAEEKTSAVKDLLKETKEYIERFEESITQMETPEARDALKTAQVFINSVNVDTKYDNTAFIVVLASLLTGTPVDALTELKKINHKLFERIKEQSSFTGLSLAGRRVRRRL